MHLKMSKILIIWAGVWKKLPYTYASNDYRNSSFNWFPFLSGFYSKDAIIEFAYLKGNTTGYYAAGIGIFTAFLTSIYSWRLIFKTFHGEYNNKEVKIEETHESPIVMLIPLSNIINRCYICWISI